MRLQVKLHPGSREQRLEEGDPWEVWVTEPARKGKANLALLKAVAAHFSVSTARVRIIGGAASRRKLLEVDI
jgi:uncharacterized protein YggU (UPF0235/DUF167 family)